MRIALDLTNTLIPATADFPVERSAPLLRLLLREPHRVGARELLRRLFLDGHEIWIYTSSRRSIVHLRVYFRLLGIPRGGLVNGDRHDDLLRRGHCPPCSKYPPAFGIDLLIDDSEGVAEEGRRHHFTVCRVAPDDTAWTDTILRAVARATPASPESHA